jgi:hypothetical protein
MSSKVIRFSISNEFAQRADAVIERLQRTLPVGDTINRNTFAHYAFKVMVEQEESKLRIYAVWFHDNGDEQEQIEVKDVSGLYKAILVDNPDLDDKDVIEKVLNDTDASEIVKATNKFEAIKKAAENMGKL